MSKYIQLIKKAAAGAPEGSFEWVERRPSLQNEVNKIYEDAVLGALDSLRDKLVGRRTYRTIWDTIPYNTEIGKDLYTRRNMFGDPTYIGQDNEDVYNTLRLWGQLANQEGKYTGGPWAGAAYRWVDSLGDIHNTTKGVKDTLKEVLDNYALKRTADEAFTKHLPSAHALDQFKDINKKISKKTFLNNLFLKNAPTTVGGIAGGRYLSGGKYKTKTDKLKYLLGDWIGGGILSKLFRGWHQSNAGKISDSVKEESKNLNKLVGRQHTKNTNPDKIKDLDKHRLVMNTMHKVLKQMDSSVASKSGSTKSK